MPGKLVYLLAVVFFNAGLSFSQQASKIVTLPSDKTKISVAVNDVVRLIEGKVIAVVDGDSVKVKTKDGKVYSIRLQGIDAPEGRQNFGKESRDMLIGLIFGKDVTVVTYKKNLYDRYVGNVYSDGKDINLRQIEKGMAWHYKQYGNEQKAIDRKIYEQAEQKAREKRIGLWKDADPVPPWTHKDGGNAGGETRTDKEEKPTPGSAVNSNNNQAAPSSSPNDSPNKKYIRGPRGGCYYINGGGGKTYVKRELCQGL